MTSEIALTADVDPTATIGEGCRVWHLAQIRAGATLGPNCIVGRAAYIGEGVSVGANCKIQNMALVYEPAELASGVFVGPAAILTNDQYPRAITPEGAPKGPSDWSRVGVRVCEGASIGARAVCVAPVVIGRWSMVAAGAVVTRNVPDFALVAGVPAESVGWVGMAGMRLTTEDGITWVCPSTGATYRLGETCMRELTRE